MSWQVRVVPNRYADSVRLMGIARALREHGRRAGVRGRHGHAGEPRGAGGAAAPAPRRRPADVVIAVDGRGRPGRRGRCAEAQRLAGRRRRAGDAGTGRRRAPLAAARRRRQRRAHLGARRVRDARGAPRADAGPARLPVLRPRSRRGRDRAQAPRRRARAAGHGPGLRHRDARRRRARVRQRRARRARSASSPRPGTGAQEVACLLDAAGSGVSHIIGVGGRDLSPRSAGRMFRQGMRMLAGDDADRDAAARVQAAGARGRSSAGRRRARRQASRRGVRGLGGRPDAASRCTPTLEAGALAAAGAAARDPTTTAARVQARPRPAVLGLFSGGSLAHEAASCSTRCSVPSRPSPRRSRADGHVVLDLGEERVHPGAPAPDGRPGHPAASCSRRRPATSDSAACCSTSCSATARTPIPPPSWRGAVGRGPRARRGGRARLRHRRRPAGRRAPGRGAARRRRGRRAVQRRRRSARRRGRCA